ncbi:MAG: hypothetical protein R3A50_09470 [Saprospiraceae bacterium]|nr:hypothetical protein [Saprospiraceae bacterium]MCB9344641.1 hypothetical protein [Lewinellaceae bacterium]
MRILLVLLGFITCSGIAFGQKETVLEKGTVTYVSSLNVYVKFSSTENINKGDTLFVESGYKMLPALVVKDKSSTSCVCSSLLSEKPKVGDVLTSRSVVEKKPEPEKEKKRKPEATTAKKENPKPASGTGVTQAVNARKQNIKGRISAASYSSFYGEDVSHRMRYTFTLRGDHLNNSRFSTDTYISFRHTLGESATIKNNLADALKVYTLAVKYDFSKNTNISLGRKINYRVSSMGAIDGAQFEQGIGDKLVLGAIAGWRPNYLDYSFNSKLFQAGVYASLNSGKANKTLQTTFAVVEQRNANKIDRRFLYFQHTNSLSRSLNLFTSFEFDLYQNVNNEVTNNVSLTNLLISLRYRASRKLNLSLSYDNRKNIIYYESYKSYIDQLIDNETRQGLRLGGSYRITKLFTLGFNGNWRFQKSDLNLSKNINTYLNISRIPGLNARANISANFLQTNYLDSKIYGARLSKELIRRKLNAEIYYRMVDYKYKNYDYNILQHIAGLDFSWNITRKLAFYIYYEGTIDSKNKPFSRFNAKIIQRF